VSENVKRWYVYNGELLSGDEYDPAEDDENLYVPVVFGPGYDALLAERDALREALGQIYRMPCAFPDDKHESQKIVINFGVAQQIAGAALAWRAATGEGA